MTTLIAACVDGRSETVELLLEAGAYVNAGECVSWTALIAASESGHVETAKILLNAGANLNGGRLDGSAHGVLCGSN